MCQYAMWMPSEACRNAQVPGEMVQRRPFDCDTSRLEVKAARSRQVTDSSGTQTALHVMGCTRSADEMASFLTW